MIKLFTNMEQIRLLNSKATFWKLKLLIRHVLFTTFMNPMPPPPPPENERKIRVPLHYGCLSKIFVFYWDSKKVDLDVET